MISAETASATAFPAARHFAIAAVFFGAFAIYGSLVPWDFERLAFDEAVRRFRELPLLDIGIKSRSDWVANVLLFLPIGFLSMGAATVDRSPSIVRDALYGLLIWIACIGLSIAIEFSQVWFPARTTSQYDIQAESLGAAIGILVAAITAAPLARWLQRAIPSREPIGRVVWLLQLYVVGLIVYEIMPLDITIHPREIWEKFKAGRIEIIPFASWRFDFTTLATVTNDVLLHIPLGAWCALGPLNDLRRPGAFRRAVWWSVAIVVACEIAQVVVYSRYAASTDVLTSGVGAVIGAYLAVRITCRESPSPLHETGRHDFFWAALVGFVAVYVAFLVVVYWSPFEVLADAARVEKRLRNFVSVPFSKLYWGSEFNYMTQILGKVLSFAPLGIAAAVGIRRLNITSRVVRGAALFIGVSGVAALGCAIELGQAIFLPHFPDITDVIFYTAGGTAGFLAGRYVLGTRSPI